MGDHGALCVSVRRWRDGVLRSKREPPARAHPVPPFFQHRPLCRPSAGAPGRTCPELSDRALSDPLCLVKSLDCLKKWATKKCKEKTEKVIVIFPLVIGIQSIFVLPKLATINMVNFYNGKINLNKLKLKATHRGLGRTTVTLKSWLPGKSGPPSSVCTPC